MILRSRLRSCWNRYDGSYPLVQFGLQNAVKHIGTIWSQVFWSCGPTFVIYPSINDYKKSYSNKTVRYGIKSTVLISCFCGLSFQLYSTMILSAIVCASLVYSAQAIVSGVVFDRYISIWLENTDFSSASADRAYRSTCLNAVVKMAHNLNLL